jgi:hypothetical protein
MCNMTSPLRTIFVCNQVHGRIVILEQDVADYVSRSYYRFRQCKPKLGTPMKGDLLMPDYGLKTFISSWHNTVRHTLACSSLNVTSPLILEAPFGKGPCQAAIIRHPTVCTDRTHKVGAQSLPWPPSFATLLVKTILIQKV